MSKKLTYEEVNAIWDRADFAAAALLREMDDLLLEMQNAPPETRRQFDARFLPLPDPGIGGVVQLCLIFGRMS
jgi:hypothetical protein